MTITPIDRELKLLDLARRVAVNAELVSEQQLALVSRDGAKNARKDILEAIERLQEFARALSYRINEE